MVNSRAIAAGIPVLQGGEDVNVLLEMGCDPELKDKRGRRAVSELQGAMRDNWQNVCKSFAARKKAHGLLDELENDAAPAKRLTA